MVLIFPFLREITVFFNDMGAFSPALFSTLLLIDEEGNPPLSLPPDQRPPVPCWMRTHPLCGRSACESHPPGIVSLSVDLSCTVPPRLRVVTPFSETPLPSFLSPSEIKWQGACFCLSAILSFYNTSLAMNLLRLPPGCFRALVQDLPLVLLFFDAQIC